MTRNNRVPIGVALVAASLVVNPWVFGYLATSDGRVDRIRMSSILVLLAGLCLFAGLQLLIGWVDRISWQRPANLPTAAAVVFLAASVVAGVHWRIATYQRGHNHTMLVESGHEHPTPEQERWATEFYQRSLDAAKRHGWFDIDNALAQGFQVDLVNGDHYPNQQYMFDDVILDPDRPEWLVYHDSPNGKVLMALMFFTRRLDEVGPTPGGPLAQWHYHPYDDVRCAIKGLWTVAKADDHGRCAEGVPVTRTPEMLHVWFMDHPLGHFSEMKIVPDYRLDRKFNQAQLHPMVVHFPIALFAVAVLLDFGGLITRKAQLHWAAWVNLVLAAVATVAAVTAGLTAEVMLRPTHEMHQLLDQHKLLGFTGLGVVLLLAAWRYALGGNFPQRGMLLYGLVSLAGLGAIGGAGYYGAELVFDHGAGVRAMDIFARERYWQEVQRVYRQEPPGMLEHAAHH